jgi:undecaprenyl-diphosphatase
MEDILRAIALGIIQGLTEFLPISSSGHLIVARDLFNWEFADDLTFDVALHVGTTVAVIGFFRREWLHMLRSGLSWALDRKRADAPPDAVYNSKLLLLLAAGSIPVGVAGILFELFVGDTLRDPIVAGAMLVAFAIVLYGAERAAERSRDLDDFRLRDAVLVGAAQAIALVPGVSRSGVTISAGLGLGLSREAAARFSFLLATPAIIGAGVLKTGEAIVDGIPSGDGDIIIVGAIVSAIVGWVSIGWLLRLIRASTFLPFVGYRLLAGTFAIVYFAV